MRMLFLLLAAAAWAQEPTLNDAERKFQECLKLAPEDGPSQLFEQRVAFLRANPPAADWQGVWHATEK